VVLNASVNLGTRISAWRHERGLSQKKLAAAVGVTVSAVSLWEANHTKPRQKHLDALVDALGLTMVRFYGQAPKARRAAA
jgi:transcriptional regulator with XRE-family HTH domain